MINELEQTKMNKMQKIKKGLAKDVYIQFCHTRIFLINQFQACMDGQLQNIDIRGLDNL